MGDSWMGNGGRGWRLTAWPRDGDAGPDEGHVVLIHGLGGIGKTTLVRQLREVAMASGGRRLVAAQVLDCERERDRYPGDYAGAEGPPIWRVLEGLRTSEMSGPTRAGSGQRSAAPDS